MMTNIFKTLIENYLSLRTCYKAQLQCFLVSLLLYPPILNRGSQSAPECIMMMMMIMMNVTSNVGSVLENIRRVASPSLGVCWRLMITFRCHHHDYELRMRRRTYIMIMMIHDDNTRADYLYYHPTYLSYLAIFIK